MSEPKLHCQLNEKLVELQSHVDDLTESDSLKKWFQFELRSLRVAPGATPDLSELNARMRGVTQLSFLVREHLQQVGNPNCANVPAEADESLHTLMSRLPAQVLAAARETNFTIEPSILLSDAERCADFDAVSVTAKIVGYLRGMDDSLAFARALSFAADAERSLNSLGITAAETRARMAVLFQARYHCINAAIAASRTRQILEIAAGISPRGLQWSRSNPGTIYIESDLPILMKQKAKILRSLALDSATGRRGVLHCCGIDAFDLKSLRYALTYTDPSCALVIVTEGLLLYFDADELRDFLTNMRIILTEQPKAKWIVDLVSRSNLEELCRSDPDLAEAVRKVFSQTGRSVIQSNPFISESYIEKCLDDHGLQPQSRIPLVEMTTLLQTYDKVSRDQMRSIVGSRSIWTITARVDDLP